LPLAVGLSNAQHELRLIDLIDGVFCRDEDRAVVSHRDVKMVVGSAIALGDRFNRLKDVIGVGVPMGDKVYGVMSLIGPNDKATVGQ
jgi:hypothetical protein